MAADAARAEILDFMESPLRIKLYMHVYERIRTAASNNFVRFDLAAALRLGKFIGDALERLKPPN
jgi:hypothetical protein